MKKKKLFIPEFEDIKSIGTQLDPKTNEYIGVSITTKDGVGGFPYNKEELSLKATEKLIKEFNEFEQEQKPQLQLNEGDVYELLFYYLLNQLLNQLQKH